MRSRLNNIVLNYKELRGKYTEDYLPVKSNKQGYKELYNRLIGHKSIKYRYPLKTSKVHLKPIWSMNKRERKRYKRRMWFKIKRITKLYKRTILKHIYNMVKVAKVYVNISTNNTHVTIISLDKDNVKRSIIYSAGSIAGIKGTKRSIPRATDIVVKRSLYILKKLNKQARILHLYRSGVGRGRSVVRKSMIASRLKIQLIRDVTSVPHNGTRKESRRRV